MTVLAAADVLIGAKVAPALAGIAKVQTSMAGLAARGARAGSLMSKGLTLPIAAGFAFAIKSAADFESSLNDMQAVSGATATQMKQVSETAKQLGADTKLPGTSAKDAAEAMVQLAKGGMTASQSMKAARGTLMLAAAAGIDNAKAAEIQSDTLNAFAMKASQAGKVADVLAASANASTAEITDMAASLQQSATVAHQSGMGLTETAVALSMMANEGIKGSDAGTSLKTMLMRLQAPIGAGAKAISEYGITLRDAGGELRSMPQLAKEFQARLGGLGKAQKDAAMAAIFGTDAIRAGNILLSKSKEDYAALTAQLNANGAAQKLAESKMRGFNGSLEAFRSTVETAAISVGQILLPMATQIIQKITEWAGAFDRLNPAQQRAVVGMAALAAAVGPALIVFSKLQGVTGGLGFSLGGIGGPLGIAAALFAAAAMSSDSARASFMQMGAAVAPMAQALASVASSPITLFMVGAGAAALGLVKAFLALRGALAALTLAAATNPFGAFIVAAGLVAGAIAGLTVSMGGGRSSMQSMADATDAAKAALDRLKGATLGVDQANLSHKAALLEVKAAEVGVDTVRQQVTSGLITGKAATVAMGQAQNRLAQAHIGVRQTAAGVASAVKTETKETAAANAEARDRITQAQKNVQSAKQAISIYGATAQNLAKLRDAQRELNSAQKDANSSAGAMTSKIRDSSGALTVMSSRLASLKQSWNGLRPPANLTLNVKDLASPKTKTVERNLNALKPKSLTVSATDHATAPIQGIKRELSSLPTSKTVTVTVVPVHKKGSWTVQETLEHLAATPARLMKTVVIKPEGTAEMERTLRLTTELRSAITGARQNAGSLASSLASAVTAGIDALTGRRISALGNSPEAQQLRAIQQAQKEQNTAREKARLQDAISTAETEKDRQSAIADMQAWELDQTRQALEEQLALKEKAITDEADARKTATERGIADLNNAFQRGLISQASFNEELNALLASSEMSYAVLGDLLGGAFASSFDDALSGLRDQIRTLAGYAGIQLPGAEVQDPFATQMDQWRNRRKTLADNLAEARKDAAQKTGPGKGTITKAEQDRIDKAQAALTAWDKRKPIRAALGGVIQGFGKRDSVPALLQPGEGVLSHRGMDTLIAAVGGRGGGSATGSSVTVNVTVQGSVIGAHGGERGLARELAEIVGPELNRRITLAA